MNIESAILGILSWKSQSGYDLKKIFEQSPIMYWSGNNNQIYKALTKLHRGGLATTEVLYQESAPVRKVYSITDKGLTELKETVLETPDGPEWKKAFLIQLAWAEMITDDEFLELLKKYEEKVRNTLLMEKEKKRRGEMPDRSSREIFLWEKIYENIFLSLQSELDWIDKMRSEFINNVAPE